VEAYASQTQEWLPAFVEAYGMMASNVPDGIKLKKPLVVHE